MKDGKIEKIKDLPVEHLLAGGTSMCSGCGALGALHQMYDILGENTVIINAAGCLTLLATYPFTPLRGSWLYTAMASSAAGAQGVRDAMDILMKKKRLSPADNLQVVSLAGDGSSYGMGLSAVSAAIERGLDFIYICYDNEGYGNTGQQSSDATPFAVRSASSSQNRFEKKDLFAIWAAHRPVYCATVTAAESLDLAKKLEKAKSLRGPRLILAYSPCPTGWDFEGQNSIEVGRLAVKTGIWQLKEYENGRTVITKKPSERLPVEEYLKIQGRYRHLFEPVRNDEAVDMIQSAVDRTWAE